MASTHHPRTCDRWIFPKLRLFVPSVDDHSTATKHIRNTSFKPPLLVDFRCQQEDASSAIATHGHDLTHVTVRFGTSTIGLHICFQFTAAFQIELQVSFTWLALSLCPFPAFACCVLPASPCGCQRRSFRRASCELGVSLFTCLVAPGGFARLDRHIVVSLWSAPLCAPPVVVVDRQFIRFLLMLLTSCPCPTSLARACFSPSIMSHFQLFR